jgi:hypothetical protein
MNPRRLATLVFALLLMIPAGSAYAQDPATQEVNVRVLPPNALAIQVDNWADLGSMVLGEVREHDFGMSVINTTSGGFQVTVIGDDLRSFNWTDCGEGGCFGPVPTDPEYTIPKENLIVTGGDLDWWDGVDPTGNTVRPYAVVPGDELSPAVVLEATAYAVGDFGFDNPNPQLKLTIPSDAQTMYQYRTELTYTIMGWTP